MTESTNFTPDPLETLLRPGAAENDELLRGRLLDRTRRLLRSRRRRRFVAWGVAAAACYLAGALSVAWLGPRRIERVEVVKELPKETAPAPARQPAVPSREPADAVAAEWKAFDADRGRAELYHQAGDRYLHEEGDPASALRCYGQALDGAGDKDLTISADDDYLLMIVKNARQKENGHAKRGG